MEENKKEEKKKFNIKERWKDKRERAKIELMLYGIFFLAIIIFARISSSFSDSNIPKDNDIKSFINDITDNYQYDIDITIDNNNYKYYGSKLGHNMDITRVVDNKEDYFYQMNDKYYIFFGANDIQSNNELGGIGVAVADNPAGPFKDALGKPLIDKFVNGAQPIDQFVYKDDDGQYYMYYGGWGHCNMVKLAPDLLSIVPFEDGTLYKEVNPEKYVEGPFMLKRNGKYYFMWSEGGWTGPDYCVAYAIADSPFGPFKREAKILQRDPNIGTGAGHHSVVKGPGEDEWYIIYHRHPLGETDGNARVTCVDRMYFDKDGKIKPIKMTFEGVEASPLK